MTYYDKYLDLKDNRHRLALQTGGVVMDSGHGNNTLKVDKRAFEDNSLTINLTINASFGKDDNSEQFKSFSDSIVNALSKILPINREKTKTMQERFSDKSEIVESDGVENV